MGAIPSLAMCTQCTCTEPVEAKVIRRHLRQSEQDLSEAQRFQLRELEHYHESRRLYWNQRLQEAYSPQPQPAPIMLPSTLAQSAEQLPEDTPCTRLQLMLLMCAPRALDIKGCPLSSLPSELLKELDLCLFGDPKPTILLHLRRISWNGHPLFQFPSLMFYRLPLRESLSRLYYLSDADIANRRFYSARGTRMFSLDEAPSTLGLLHNDVILFVILSDLPMLDNHPHEPLGAQLAET